MAYGSPQNTPPKAGNCFVALALLGMLGMGGYIFLTRRTPFPPPPQTVSAPPFPGGNRTSGILPNADNEILFLYGRSTKKWMEQAADEFNAANAGKYRIRLEAKGSRDGKQEILFGKSQPVLWSPADAYWVDKLDIDWSSAQIKNRTSGSIADSRPILRSLFVLVMWEDRAKVFQAAMQTPAYRGRTWKLCADLAAKGWASVGGSAAWGRLKLAQTEATESNSGQAVLALMLAEYRRDHPNARSDDPGFVAFLRAVEGAVPEFGDTTSRLVEGFVKAGPQTADAALAYESNALAALDGGAEHLRVVYPTPTVATDYPAATLRADWVSPGQTEGARRFVDFLLTEPVQKRALDYGFRPVLPNLRGAVDTALSKGRRGQAGFLLDPLTVLRPVSTRDVDRLLYTWYKLYGRK